MKKFGKELEFFFVKKFIFYRLHVGSQNTLWKPLIKPYIKGFRNQLSIFNVELSVLYFRRSLKFLLKLLMSKKKILFVGTPLGFEKEFKSLCSKYMHYTLDTDSFGAFSNYSNLIPYYTSKSQGFYEKPSLIFLFSLPSNSSFLSEISKLDIPVMSFVNSDDDLLGVDYILPGNIKTIKGSLFIYNFFNSLFNSQSLLTYRT
jgi:ribosomal protein S2